MAEEDAFEAFEGRLGNATSEPSETRRPTRGFLKSAKDVAIPAHKRTKNFVELTGADPLELDAETPAGMKIADDDTVAASSGSAFSKLTSGQQGSCVMGCIVGMIIGGSIVGIAMGGPGTTSASSTGRATTSAIAWPSLPGLPPVPPPTPRQPPWPPLAESPPPPFPPPPPPPSPPAPSPPPPQPRFPPVPPRPPPSASPLSPPSEIANALNHRFAADPSETWSAVGQPPDLGVLIHCFDEREEAAQPWMPKTPPNGEPYTADYLKMSGSLIYSAQQQSSTQIPLFNDGSSGGVVLRPSATRVFCGFGADAGGLGHCAPQSTDCYPGCWQAGKTWSVWCEPEEVHLHGNQEGTCYNRPYRPADMGVLFERAALNGHYNEVIVDSLHWAAHLPDAIEAFWYHAGTDDLVVQQLQQWHTRFLAAYPGASAATYPLLILDRTDWQTPFSGG